MAKVSVRIWVLYAQASYMLMYFYMFCPQAQMWGVRPDSFSLKCSFPRSVGFWSCIVLYCWRDVDNTMIMAENMTTIWMVWFMELIFIETGLSNIPGVCTLYGLLAYSSHECVTLPLKTDDTDIYISIFGKICAWVHGGRAHTVNDWVKLEFIWIVFAIKKVSHEIKLL